MESRSSPESAEFEQGRTIVRIVCVAMVGVGLVVAILRNVMRGPEVLPQQLVRLGIECWLAYGLLKGSKLARAILIVLIPIACLCMTGLLIANDSRGRSTEPGMVAILVLYLAFFGLLVFPKSVRTFFGLNDTPQA